MPDERKTFLEEVGFPIYLQTTIVIIIAVLIMLKPITDFLHIMEISAAVDLGVLLAFILFLLNRRDAKKHKDEIATLIKKHNEEILSLQKQLDEKAWEGIRAANSRAIMYS